MALDVLLFAQFIIVWICDYRRTGWKIDFWHSTISLAFIVPVLVMYPFNASPLNVVTTGAGFKYIEPLVNTAFLITVAGYVSMLVGRTFYNVFGLRTPFAIPLIALRGYERAVEKCCNRGSAIRLLALTVIGACLLLMIFIAGVGNIADPRGYFMAHASVRPLYNLLFSIYGTIVIFVFLRWKLTKSRLDKWLMFLLAIAGLSLGTRGALFGSFVAVYLLHIYSKRGRISLTYLFLAAVIVLSLAILQGGIRNGGSTDVVASFFYGNNFSDTRDFAWVIAYWDGTYVLGKTYLAGLMSFIPSFISPYREIWSLSKYTNEFLNFDSTVHPGLRPGFFGEAYLNFGIFGVCFLGLIAGYVLQYSNKRLQGVIERGGSLIEAYSKTMPYMIITFFYVSAGFFILYTFLGTVLLISGLNFILTSTASRRYKMSEDISTIK